MGDFRKLGVPFLVIFISALLFKILSLYVIQDLNSTLYKFIMVIALFVFGATLNVVRGKRSESVYKKLISVLVVLFLLFMQLNWFTFSSVTSLFAFFGIDAFYINMLYIYCGYLFVD